MKKLFISVLQCFFISTVALAQISGRVFDLQTGAGLEGSTVITNTGLATISNTDGYFTFDPANGSIKNLQISYVGYKPLSIDISGKQVSVMAGLEPDPRAIQELVISVSGLPGSIRRSTGSVSSLTHQNLQVHNGMVLNDAINQVPGLYMAGGGYNTNRLIIRGIGSRSPYSSNRIRAYLDFIPLTSGDGTTTIEDIDIASISRIEVLKGPSSAAYGSGLGGAIRLYSYQPEDDRLSLKINFEAGSFGTYRSFIRSGYKSDKGTISLVYSNSRSAGYRQNSRFLRNSLLFSSGRNFNQTGLKFILLYTDVEAEIPSSVTLTSFTSDPKLAAPNWLAINGYEQYKKLLMGVSSETNVKPGLFNRSAVFVSLSDPYESRPFNILDENSKSAGFSEHLHLTTGKFEFMAGGEVFLEGFNWRVFETIGGEQGNLMADNREKRFYLNTSTLARYKPGNKFTAEIGLSMNILNYSLEDLFIADSLDLSGKYSYEPTFSPRLGINYLTGRDISLHASVGHGFSAPSLEETLLPGGQINTALKPETGWNFDAGIRGNAISRKISYDFTLYHIALSNLLVTRRISEEIFSGINAGKTSHSGLETMIRVNLLSPEFKDKTELTLTSSLTASINSFNDFSDNNTDYSGKKLPGIPSTILNNTLRLKFLKSLEFTILHKFTGRQFINDSNSNDYESWQITDLRLDYTINIGQKNQTIHFYGGVKNLFDKNFAGMILVNAPSFGGAEPRYYYPGLPRNYFLGISIDF